MVGWEVSRHPEWDMMYTAGLTVREIADRCNHKRNTVHLHLQVREHYEPGLRTAHEKALAARDPDRPTTGWRRRLKEAQDFLATHGRLPRYDGDTVERSLHVWVGEQRRAYHRGQLSTPKIVLLGNALSGWNIATRQLELDQHWQTRLNQLLDYIKATSQIPRYRKYETENEHKLGVWLHAQHQERLKNTLNPWRLKALNDSIVNWHSRT